MLIRFSSIQNQLEIIEEVISNKIALLLLSETNVDDKFPLSQFIFERFTPPYKFDRIKNS